MKKFTLITTTINVPKLLEAYAKDALRHKRFIEQFIVVGDKKTPEATAEFCRGFEQKHGIACRYFSVADQESFLQRYPTLATFIPWNCIQRRNIGLLAAYEGKADIVVTIDDDNFLHDKDYFGRHAHVGDQIEVPHVRSKSGWWNVCEMLVRPDKYPFYHRGFPLSKRWVDKKTKTVFKKKKSRVVVNAGLWLDEPDIDALTRLYFAPGSVKTSSAYKPRVACDVGTWSPFNSQNTALAREVIPAYFLFPHIGRYDDIWASYVVRHISDAFGYVVTFGAPLVRQLRNPHNYFKDFEAEKFGLDYNDQFLKALRSCRLSARDYKGAFAEIAEQFPAAIKKVCEEERRDSSLFDQVSKGMTAWAQAFNAGR